MDNHDHIALAGGYRKGGGRTLSYTVLSIIYPILLLSVLPSCSPKIVEKTKTEYVYQDVHHRDTIITKDSVYIREWMKGDTVYVEKYRDKYVYRDRWRDSISIKEVHDTTTVEKKVEKELTAGQKTKIGAFWWLVLAVAGFAVWTFRKPILKLLKTILK